VLGDWKFQDLGRSGREWTSSCSGLSSRVGHKCIKLSMGWGYWRHVHNHGGPTILWKVGFLNNSGRLELFGRVIKDMDDGGCGWGSE
jgi:hypothetical protein